MMLDGLITIPKTRAGQYIKGDSIRVIKERLTSYGSMALVNSNNCYLIIYWDLNSLSFLFTDCGRNIRFINTMWEEIV